MNLAPAKYLFTLIYLRDDQKDQTRKIEFSEHVVAETWDQAREYWKLEFMDEGVDVLELKRQVPVVAICPSAITERYGNAEPVSHQPEPNGGAKGETR